MSVIINGSNTPTAGGVTYGDGTQYATTAAGTSGQVLTSAGASAPTWTTITVSGSGGATASGNVTLTSASSGAQSITTTDYGQYVKLPDATTVTKAACVFNVYNNGPYPAKIINSASTVLGFINPYTSATIGLADSSTAAGSWTLSGIDFLATTAKKTFIGSYPATMSQALVLDSDRTLIIFASAANATYGVVYNSTTQTWGSVTLIRTPSGKQASILIATNTVLTFSCTGTAMQAVVLSISGTTITVNTAATTTLAATGTIGNSDALNAATSVIACGSTYICQYYTSSNPKMIAATVSGTTVTFGSEVTMQGIGANMGSIFYVNATTLLTFSAENTVGIYAKPYSVSGTTLTAGTGVTLSSTVSTSLSSPLRVGTISSGARWWVAYPNTTTTTLTVSVISVSGTTATASTVDALTGINANCVNDPVGKIDIAVVGSKLLVNIADNSTPAGVCNLVTDTSGTASAGTQLTYATAQAYIYAAILYADSSTAQVFAGTAAAGWQLANISISGSSPSILGLADSGTANATIWTTSKPTTAWNSQKLGQWIKGKFILNLNSTTNPHVAVFNKNGFTTPSLATQALNTPTMFTADNDVYYETNGGLTSTKTLFRIETIA